MPTTTRSDFSTQGADGGEQPPAPPLMPGSAQTGVVRAPRQQPDDAAARRSRLSPGRIGEGDRVIGRVERGQQLLVVPQRARQHPSGYRKQLRRLGVTQ
jgi:hypothetical protein